MTLRSLRSCAALLALWVVASLTGCTPNKPAPEALPDPTKPISTSPVMGFPRNVTDSRGKTITLPTPPSRIVSLAPSNTEILFALGAEKQIAAVTTACDYPEQAKALPNVGDYPISVEKVQAFNPDLVVTVGTINQRITDPLEKANIPVLAVDPKNVAQVLETIRLLGQATGTEKRAEEIVAEAEKEIKDIAAKVARSPKRPKTLIMYQTKPIYTTGPGTFIDEAIKAAGGINVVKEPLPESKLSPERVLILAPEVIICSPELQPEIKRLPGWAANVPAVRESRFYSSANSSPLVRPGPRVGQAIRDLAQFLHPEAFAASAPNTAPKR